MMCVCFKWMWIRVSNGYGLTFPTWIHVAYTLAPTLAIIIHTNHSCEIDRGNKRNTVASKRDRVVQGATFRS